MLYLLILAIPVAIIFYKIEKNTPKPEQPKIPELYELLPGGPKDYLFSMIDPTINNETEFSREVKKELQEYRKLYGIKTIEDLEKEEEELLDDLLKKDINEMSEEEKEFIRNKAYEM